MEVELSDLNLTRSALRFLESHDIKSLEQLQAYSLEELSTMCIDDNDRRLVYQIVDAMKECCVDLRQDSE